MMPWFTADPHFGHANIIKYCKRPFKDVTEMNETLIRNWNSVVQPGDEVYVVGDFAFHGVEGISTLLSRLNGTKYLIIGNHDDKNVLEAEGWEDIQDYAELKINGQHIILCHYGMRVWNRSHKGSTMLYGHSHGQLPGNSQSLDVGVDVWNYRPVNLAQINKRLKTLPPYVSGEAWQEKWEKPTTN